MSLCQDYFGVALKSYFAPFASRGTAQKAKGAGGVVQCGEICRNALITQKGVLSWSHAWVVKAHRNASPVRLNMYVTVSHTEPPVSVVWLVFLCQLCSSCSFLHAKACPEERLSLSWGLFSVLFMHFLHFELIISVLNSILLELKAQGGVFTCSSARITAVTRPQNTRFKVFSLYLTADAQAFNRRYTQEMKKIKQTS